jgi:hypothetical protein
LKEFFFFFERFLRDGIFFFFKRNPVAKARLDFYLLPRWKENRKDIFGVPLQKGPNGLLKKKLGKREMRK